MGQQLGSANRRIDRRVWHHLSVGNEHYLVASEFPSSEVRTNIAKYVAANVPLLQSGDTVGVVVDVKGRTPKPDMRQQLTETVTAALKSAGYTIGDGQPYRLRVTLEDKDSGRTLEYRTMGFGGGGSGTVSVPDRRIECEVAFVNSNEKVVWQTSNSIGPSSVSCTRNGGTDFATNVLNSRWKTFDGWIQNVRIAGLVRKFSSTGEFGSSMLKADGERIVKVPTE